MGRSRECTCGHEYTEHDWSEPCDVSGCMCGSYEPVDAPSSDEITVSREDLRVLLASREWGISEAEFAAADRLRAALEGKDG